MKRLLLPLISAMLCAMLCFGIFAAEKIEIKMTIGEKVGYVNGEAKELDAAPIIRGNRTMLPVRFVAENLGATVAWDPTTSTAILKTEEVEIKITIGAAEAYVNGEAVTLDAPAFIENSRTYLPVRFVAENLGATVEWDGETSTATITLGGFVPFPDDYTPDYSSDFYYSPDNVTDYINLGQYKGLTIEADFPPEITDEDVNDHISALLMENPVINQITDRPAELGDDIIVNFVGKIDGVAFEGGSAQLYEITLGNGGFIEGFEEGMVGMKVGETKNVETVFPENYGNADLAGKTAIFEITLILIYEEIPAELNDAYVKETFGYDTVEEFIEATKAELIDERNSEILDIKASAVLTKVIENSEVIRYPEKAVDYYMYQLISSVKEGAAQYGFSYETVLLYSGYTVEQYETQIRSVAENSVKKDLVMMAIAKTEGLTVDQELYDMIVQSFIQAYGLSSITELCEFMGYSEEYLKGILEFSSLYEKALNFLIENNTFNG